MSAKDKEKVDMNKTSSSASLSEDLSGDEDEEDLQIKRIFAEEILNCEVLDALPPTPVRPERPSTRAEDVKGGSKSAKKDKDACRALGFDIDDSELDELEKDDRIPVDNVLDDILNMGLGKKRRGAKNKAGTSTRLTAEEDNLMNQYDKLRGKAPLEITTEGRVAVLQKDVQTVRKTKEAVDALIALLERTKDRLINDDSSLVYTEPPLMVSAKKERYRATSVKKPQSS